MGIERDIEGFEFGVGSGGGVTSVNTRTGDVLLTKSDVGLSSVDNTSDLNKPVSNATQTAINNVIATIYLKYFDTIAAAEAITTYTTNDIIFVLETHTFYKYNASAGTYTRDAKYILNTGSGGTTRLLGEAGRYTLGQAGAANGGISLGVTDAFSRGQIWNALTNAVLRLGSLAQDGDPNNTSSEGIVAYGTNSAGAFNATNWAYARIKSTRLGINDCIANVQYYLFRADEVGLYMKNTSGNKVFDFVIATGIFRVGDIAGGNYLTVEGDGTIKMNGNATVFTDLTPTCASIGTGVNAPVFSTFTDALRAYEFVGTGAQFKEFFMAFQLPHSYKEGSNIVPHIHLYIPDDATGGVIKFQCDYVWTNIDTTGSVATTNLTGTITRTASQGINNNAILSFGTITGTGKTISSILTCRIWRDPTDVADTFGSSVWSLSVDIHYEMDTLGSRTITTK